MNRPPPSYNITVNDDRPQFIVEDPPPYANPVPYERPAPPSMWGPVNSPGFVRPHVNVTPIVIVSSIFVAMVTTLIIVYRPV